MTLKDAVKAMLQKAKLTQRGLSEELYTGNIGSISVPLSRNAMKVETLVKWAHQCGYDLVLQPAGCLVDGQIVIGEPSKTREQVKMAYELAKKMQEASED